MGKFPHEVASGLTSRDLAEWMAFDKVRREAEAIARLGEDAQRGLAERKAALRRR